MIMWLNQIAVVWLITTIGSLGNILGAEETNTDGEVYVEKIVNRQSGDDRSLSPFSLREDKIQIDRERSNQFLDKRKEPVWLVAGKYGYKLHDGKLIAFQYTTQDNSLREHEPGENEVIGHVGDVGNRIDLKALESLIG